jgi:hypothetical protein
MRFLFRSHQTRSALRLTLGRHFRGLALEEIVTASREFPITSRVDVQQALDQQFATRPGARLLGVHSQISHETPTLAHLFTPGPFPVELNRPQHLEGAVASRPGRIDQAIEFPLPDEDGRRKLVDLYARGLEVPPPLMDLIVRRTRGRAPRSSRSCCGAQRSSRSSGVPEACSSRRRWTMRSRRWCSSAER